MQPFLAITAHWLYEEQSRSLKLGKRVIAFHRFWGRHTAKNMSKVTMKLLDRAGTTANVSAFLYNFGHSFDTLCSLVTSRSII
jgi:hypothetical protein